MLIVNGSTPAGVGDASGNLLDGNGDGKPGDNYVAILRRGFGPEKAGAPFSRLIRDQLHGQPLSSRAVITKRAHPSRCLGLPRESWAGSTEGTVSFTHCEQFRLRTRSSSG
jgi:hypothetical protein